MGGVIQIADGDEFKCCCLDFTSSIHADGFDFTPYQPLDELDPDDKLGLQSDPFSKEPPF
ncbi:MAG: hypothetical protein U5L04_01545 [Trueperaceae bacterium]|nr:hypothetical protein [Trueperaceae bacterium]